MKNREKFAVLIEEVGTIRFAQKMDSDNKVKTLLFDHYEQANNWAKCRLNCWSILMVKGTDWKCAGGATIELTLAIKIM